MHINLFQLKNYHLSFKFNHNENYKKYKFIIIMDKIRKDFTKSVQKLFLIFLFINKNR